MSQTGIQTMPPEILRDAEKLEAAEMAGNKIGAGLARRRIEKAISAYGLDRDAVWADLRGGRGPSADPPAPVAPQPQIAAQPAQRARPLGAVTVLIDGAGREYQAFIARGRDPIGYVTLAKPEDIIAVVQAFSPIEVKASIRARGRPDVAAIVAKLTGE